MAASVSCVEVVALPVVARAGRQQRIERRLPADERMRADEIDDRLAQRRSGAAALSPSASAPHSTARRSAPPLPCHSAGTKGSGGRLAQHHPGVISSGAPAMILPKAARTPAGASASGWTTARRHLRTERRAAGTRTTSPRRNCRRRRASPRTGRVLARARARSSPSAVTTSTETQVVDGQPELADQPAEAAAEREPGDAGGRVDPAGHGEPEACVSRSKSASSAPGLDAGAARGRVDRTDAHPATGRSSGRRRRWPCRRCCGRRRARPASSRARARTSTAAITSAAPAHADDQRRAGGRSCRSTRPRRVVAGVTRSSTLPRSALRKAATSSPLTGTVPLERACKCESDLVSHCRFWLRLGCYHKGPALAPSGFGICARAGRPQPHGSRRGPGPQDWNRMAPARSVSIPRRAAVRQLTVRNRAGDDAPGCPRTARRLRQAEGFKRQRC